MAKAISLTGKNGPSKRCFPEPPPMESCVPCCEPTCEPICCPPKARARDAIQMRQRETERSFRLTELQCGAYRIPVTVTKIRMNLRRRGQCNVLVCIPPNVTDMDATVTFAWPKKFLAAPPGQYEGDIFVNGCEVGTVLLVKPDCTAIIESSEAAQAEWPCDTCGEPSSGCACAPDCSALPAINESPVSVEDNCGGCRTC